MLIGFLLGAEEALDDFDEVADRRLAPERFLFFELLLGVVGTQAAIANAQGEIAGMLQQDGQRLRQRVAWVLGDDKRAKVPAVDDGVLAVYLPLAGEDLIESYMGLGQGCRMIVVG